jgi:hypothetical protein
VSAAPERVESLLWVRDWFMANGLDSSIDDAARAAHNAGQALGRSSIADIRRELRLEQEREKAAAPRPVIRSAVAARPRLRRSWWSAPSRPEEARAVASIAEGAIPGEATVAEETAVNEDPKEATMMQAVKVEMTEEQEDPRAAKLAFVDERLRAEPGVNPTVLIGDVIRRFGSGLDYRPVYERCRAARAANGLEQIPSRAEHNREEANDVVGVLVRDFAERVKASGVKLESLVLAMDGDYATEFTYDRRISVTGKVQP